MKTSLRAAMAATLLLATPAFAHITLEKSEAPPKSTYKAVLKVPHACGKSPTIAIQVTIPEGVIAAKPMPKAGWKLDIEQGDYAKPYKYFGEVLTSGVKKITWSGGNLPDDFYDEFVISTFITEGLVAGTNLYFPVEQTCEQGASHWTTITKDGETAPAGSEPAPVLKIATTQSSAPATKTYAIGELTITAPWARATPNGAKVAGAYIKITNNDHHPDRLVSASVEVAGTTQIHEMKMEGDVMKMGELPKGVEIAPHGTLSLEPGKLHLMLLDLKAPLKEGDHIKGSLTFEKAGKIDVEFDVKGLGAQAN